MKSLDKTKPRFMVRLVIFLLLAGFSFGAEPRFSVRVTVEERSREDVTVRFDITNTSAEEISVYSAFLPWSSPVATRMVLIPLSSGVSILEQNPSIEDPIAETKKLGGGETLSGSLSLAKRFATLQTILSEHGAYLFWIVNVFSAPDNRVFRSAGFTEIPAFDGAQRQTKDAGPSVLLPI